MVIKRIWPFRHYITNATLERELGVRVSLSIASSVMAKNQEIAFKVDRSSNRNISVCSHTIKH